MEHPPQLALSVCVSTHESLHKDRPVGQAHLPLSWQVRPPVQGAHNAPAGTASPALGTPGCPGQWRAGGRRAGGLRDRATRWSAGPGTTERNIPCPGDGTPCCTRSAPLRPLFPAQVHPMPRPRPQQRTRRSWLSRILALARRRTSGATRRARRGPRWLWHPRFRFCPGASAPSPPVVPKASAPLTPPPVTSPGVKPGERW